jgi:hypothetical protein
MTPETGMDSKEPITAGSASRATDQQYGAEEVVDTASDSLKSAQTLAADAASKVVDKGAGVAEDVKDRTVLEAERQKNRAAAQIEQAAQSAHHAADALREGQQTWLADLVQRGADELASFAESLHSNNLQEILSGIESFARRQPALFAGASIAAGFAVTRMARAATEQATSTRVEADGDAPAKGAEGRQWQSRAQAGNPGGIYHG